MSSLETAIVNVVATAALDRPVGLESLKESFPHEVLHNSKIYRGLTAYFKSDKMQGKVSLFSSGKMISVGTRSQENVKQELVSVANQLETKAIAKLKSPPKIRNIVATADLGFKPDLEKIAISRKAKAIYEPEQFPGAIIRLTLSEKATATFLLFPSRKIVCVGLTDPKDINTAIHRLLHIIS